MKAKAATLMGILLLSACTYGGHYARSGPCEGWHTDQASCLRAHENSTALDKVKIGQSMDEVRAIIGRPPERRSADASTERWTFLTDYNAHVVTTLVFTNGSVSAIESAPSND